MNDPTAPHSPQPPQPHQPPQYPRPEPHGYQPSYNTPAPPDRTPPSLTGPTQMVVVGLAVLAGAAVLLLRYLEVFSGHWVTAWAIAAATTLLVLALGVIAGSLRGRGGGSLTVISAVLVIPLLGATGASVARTSDWGAPWVSYGDWEDWEDWQQDQSSQLGNSPEDGYELTFTEGTINLTDLSSLPAGTPVQVELDFATAEVLVPDDRDVFIDLTSSFSSLEGPHLGSDSSGRIQVVDAPGDEQLVIEADLDFSTLRVSPSAATGSTATDTDPNSNTDPSIDSE